MNKIKEITIGGDYVLAIIDGQPNLPIIKYYQYYQEIFGNVISTPKVPGNTFKDIEKVEWFSEYSNLPGIMTDELRREKTLELEDKRSEVIEALKKDPVDNAGKITSFIASRHTLPPE